MHVPLTGDNDFDAARGFARRAADLLAARTPDAITTEQRRNKRGGRIYADVMRNAYAQTAVAPYAVRARPGAPVATPCTGRSFAMGGRPRSGSRSRWCRAGSMTWAGRTTRGRAWPGGAAAWPERSAGCRSAA